MSKNTKSLRNNDITMLCVVWEMAIMSNQSYHCENILQNDKMNRSALSSMTAILYIPILPKIGWPMEQNIYRDDKSYLTWEMKYDNSFFVTEVQFRYVIKAWLLLFLSQILTTSVPLLHQGGACSYDFPNDPNMGPWTLAVSVTSSWKCIVNRKSAPSTT